MKRLFVNIETTGIDVFKHDVICINLKTHDTETHDVNEHTYIIRPMRPYDMNGIALQMNRITIEQLANAPLFADVCDEINNVFNEADEIVGYNLKDFTLPFLQESFARVNKELTFFGNVIDMYEIQLKNNSNNMERVFKRITNNADNCDDKMHMLETIFNYQQQTYDCTCDAFISCENMLKSINDELYFTRGKHANERVIDVFKQDANYFAWLASTENKTSISELMKRAINYDIMKHHAEKKC